MKRVARYAALLCYCTLLYSKYTLSFVTFGYIQDVQNYKHVIFVQKIHRSMLTNSSYQVKL